MGSLYSKPYVPSGIIVANIVNNIRVENVPDREEKTPTGDKNAEKFPNGNTEEPVTAESLHAMMRDPKYWRDKDPATIAKVTAGFKKLYEADDHPRASSTAAPGHASGTNAAMKRHGEPTDQRNGEFNSQPDQPETTTKEKDHE